MRYIVVEYDHGDHWRERDSSRKQDRQFPYTAEVEQVLEWLLASIAMIPEAGF
jgi:hypothetical protein